MGWNFFASFLEKFSASLWRIFRRFQKSEKNFQQIDFRRALATCNEKWTTVWSGSACRSVWMLKKVRITSFLHYLSSPPRIGEKAGAEQPRNERNKRRRNFLRWTRRTTVWQLQFLRWTLLTRFRLFGPILMTNRLWALTNKRHSPVKSPVSTNQGKLVVLWNKTPLQGFPEAFTGLPLATDWIWEEGCLQWEGTKF